MSCYKFIYYDINADKIYIIDCNNQLTIYNDFKTNLIRRPNTRSITNGDSSIKENINYVYQVHYMIQI